MNNECCNHNCNQGRDCPRRNKRNLSKEITEGFKALETTRNNKPVAWIDHQDLERLPHHDCWVNGQEHKNSVPLYTHLAKEQDTDCQGGDCPLRRVERMKTENYAYTLEEIIKKLETELTEAGGMIGVLREYISDLENGLDSSIKLNKAQAGRQVKETLDTRSYLMGRYDTSPVKELTDEEIMVLYEEYIETQYASESNVLGFGRAILRKAQEK